MTKIYLDYAAATPLDPKILKSMKPYLENNFHNPSAIYLAARDIRHKVEEARETVARQLGAKPTEIVFTSGATESNNLAIHGVMRQFPKGQILVSAIEHDSVLSPASQYNHKIIPVNKQGIVDIAKLAKLITPKTVLVSVMMVNNELGTVQPIREIAKLLNMLSKQRKSSFMPLYFHTDAAQAANLLDLHVSRLGVDLLTLNGGKIYGPKQCGSLYIKAGTKLKPQILGGGQENGWRSGTENPASIIGYAEALATAQAKRSQEVKRLQQLRLLFVEQLYSNRPDAVINGSAKHQSPHLISVTFPGVDNERMVMELDEAGIETAAGSACAASDEEPSHVLLAIGLNRAEAQSTLRFSFGRQTTQGDIDKTILAIKHLTQH